jgi:hypothetical protein
LDTLTITKVTNNKDDTGGFGAKQKPLSNKREGE